MSKDRVFECAWCGEYVMVEQTREITGTEEIVCRWCCSECDHCGKVTWPDDYVDADDCDCQVCLECAKSGATRRVDLDPDDARDRARDAKRCDPDAGWCGDEPSWTAEEGIWTES